MSTVNIAPMPAAVRAITPRFRPSHPPVFTDGEPTPDDVELAIALFSELDAESQQWYGGPAFIERLRARLTSG